MVHHKKLQKKRKKTTVTWDDSLRYFSKDCPSQKFGLPGCLEKLLPPYTSYSRILYSHSNKLSTRIYTTACNGRRSDRGNVARQAYPNQRIQNDSEAL